MFVSFDHEHFPDRIGLLVFYHINITSVNLPGTDALARAIEKHQGVVIAQKAA